MLTSARSGTVIAAFIAASLVSASADDLVALKPTVTPVLSSSQTIIGQPIAYPAGAAKVTAAIVTIPPGR